LNLVDEDGAHAAGSIDPLLELIGVALKAEIVSFVIEVDS